MNEDLWTVIDGIYTLAIIGMRRRKDPLRLGDPVTNPEIEESIDRFTEVDQLHFLQRINHRPLPPRRKGGRYLYMLVWDDEFKAMKIAAYVRSDPTS